jgi:AcrR family transcriptional regulator
MSPKPDASHERIPQIIQSASRVFSKKGLHQARMEDIANEAGVSKATLYLYFSSKEDLILRIFEEFYESAFNSVPQSLPGHLSVTARLKLAFQMVSNTVAESQKMMPLTYEFYSEATRTDRIRSIIRKYYTRNQESMASLIEEGIRNGEFRQVDARTISLVLGATFEGLLLMQTILPEEVNWNQIPEEVLDSLLHGILMK